MRYLTLLCVLIFGGMFLNGCATVPAGPPPIVTIPDNSESLSAYRECDRSINMVVASQTVQSNVCAAEEDCWRGIPGAVFSNGSADGCRLLHQRGGCPWSVYACK
jgi:hypothetical protein